MRVSRTFGLSAECTQVRDYTTRFPDEILDSIIRSVGPQYGTAAIVCSEKRSWQSCSAVCRRWHRMTLPYLFRCIRVTRSNRSEDYDKHMALNFQSFLRENPSIARLILEVKFLRVAVDVQVLSSILDSMVSLQHLMFICSIVEGRLDKESSIPERTLDRLLYSGGICWQLDTSEFTCGRQIPQLLSLFSEIQEFEDTTVGCYDHGLSSMDRPAPHICSFGTTFQFDPKGQNTLLQLGVFDHITCLQLTLLSLSLLEPYGDAFLLMLQGTPTLRELYLSYTQHIDETSFNLGSELPNTIADSSGRVLAACPSLHAFRLDVTVYITAAHLTHEENVRIIFHLCFLIGLEIIALLDANRIEHIGFRYIVDYANHCRPEDTRMLDWSRLQDLCRRFVNLRSFALNIFIEPEQNEDFEICARSKMAQFKDIMLYGEPGAFFRCDDPTCAWYSKSRLNRYITLQHDILEYR